MRVFRTLGFSLLLAIPLHAEPLKPVAIVYSLTGTASLMAPRAARRPLQLFDRLPAGTALETGSDSRVALAFVNGLRYELDEKARVTLGRKDLTSRTGPVRPLPRVPLLPDLAPIAAADRPGPRAGAVRIRAEQITGLHPDHGTASLASAIRLRFDPVPATPAYRVQIIDSEGKVLFHADTQSTEISVPPEAVAPGGTYLWTVETRDRPGPVARGEAILATLEASRAQAHEELRRWVQESGDADDLRLIEAVDRALGLQDVCCPLSEPGVILSLPLAAHAIAPVPGEPEEGAVVEEATKGWAADRAGLRPGDLLLSWSQENGNRGPVRSPFDLNQIEIEQAPLGVVTLHGMREGNRQEWTLLPSGAWEIRARPTFPEALLALYRQGRDRIAAGELEAGAGHWRSAVEAADRQKDQLRAAWIEGRLARELAGAGRGPEAEAALEAAVQRLEGRQAAAAQLLRAQSETLQRRNAWDQAVELHRRALAMEPEESLAAAWDLNALGSIASRRGDLTTAEGLYRKVYALREKLAPGSIDLASSLRNLAIVAARRGDLNSAEEGFLKTREILQRLAPESLELSAVLSNLGNVALIRGDLSTAEERYRHALALIERLSPESLNLATTLANLGLVDMQRGDLAIAEERFRRALAIREKLAPESLEFALNLTYLGVLAEKRGDFAAAEEYHQHALNIREKLAPGSPDVAEALTNLGTVNRRKGHFEKAEGYLQRALEIQDRILPESNQIALTYIHRAMVAFERGNLAFAEELHGRALAILEKQFPESLPVSDSLANLGAVAFKRGNLKKAEELFRRSLAIREKMAPSSTRVGDSLDDLGQVYRQEGRLAMAAEHFCRATETFDQQRKKLGGTAEGRSAFGGEKSDSYRNCLAALVDTGRPEEAFLALERGRARSFLDLLAERDLRWTAALPPKLEQDRKQTDAEYDRTQAALGRLSPVRDQDEIDRLLVRLRELRARQEEITEKIRLASPRTAALQDPQPVNLAKARAALDSGTVLLTWSVGKERTFLFVVEPAEAQGSGLKVFPIAIGDAALREDVESFRRLLKRPDSNRKELQARARHLYDSLVQPAERQISKAQRILLSPDGPLHTLPFATLMRGDRYLVQWKPIHTVLSATVYAELKRSRPAPQEPGEEHIAIFGDPVYPQRAPDTRSDPEVREALRQGLSLQPLPYTRKEVEAVAAFYPQAQVYLGPQATEERAKAVAPESRLLHFACHGLLDEHFPLNSSLALTLPEEQAEGQDNGLLQAWEIFERVRLNADLVTLSACDTALGQEMGGEGLVGLTRAFQYAGARSVLASVWGISDLSTARFMQRFYGYLRNGKSKDEALRAAQIDQIHGKSGSSHPFYWAAFQLTGDWR